MYLEQMLFLIHLTQQQTTSSNYSPLTGNNAEEGSDERKEDAQGSSGGTSKTSMCQKQQHESNTS
jgi:hypothetical protein